MSVGRSDSASRRVLVVDDESYLRAFIKDVLEPTFEVAEAADGFVALTLLANPFDVIIVDYTMPQMSGVDLLRRIRDLPQYQKTPVVVITAIDDERALLECRELGADTIIPKPFHPQRLIETVRDLAHAER